MTLYTMTSYIPPKWLLFHFGNKLICSPHDTHEWQSKKWKILKVPKVNLKPPIANVWTQIHYNRCRRNHIKWQVADTSGDEIKKLFHHTQCKAKCLEYDSHQLDIRQIHNQHQHSHQQQPSDHHRHLKKNLPLRRKLCRERQRVPSTAFWVGDNFFVVMVMLNPSTGGLCTTWPEAKDPQWYMPPHSSEFIIRM